MMTSQSPILPVTIPFVRGRSEEPTMPMLLQKHKDDLSTNGILLSSYFPPPTSSSSSSISYLGDDQSSYTESRPLLSRAFSYDGITATTPTGLSPIANSHRNLPKKQRRRRTSSHDSLPILSDRRHSPTSSTHSLSSAISQNVGHAAAETYLVTRLSLTLLRFLGVGYRWITRFLALGCYAMLLMPGFIQVGYYYVFSSQVRRSVVYGDQPRNRLDLYLPKNNTGPKPVVAFITGGAWIIGYKAWGSLLGRQLSERDIIVACIDYRNFPQGTIGDMVNDASQGISYVCNNIAEYGGDPNRIYLMGQSAGAHIASCALIEQAIKEAGEGMSVSWSVSQIKAYFGLSGGYNLLNLVDHFHNRGLYRSIFLGIMEGEQSLHRYSPEIVVQDPSIGNAPSLLPPIYLLHGTADYSIPSEASVSFAETLKRVGVKAEAILYEGKTHTDLFLQDPMRGGKDDLFDDIIALIHVGDEEALAKDVVATPRRRLVPEIMLRGARAVSPF